MTDPSTELLNRLDTLDVRLWADGDRVRFNAPQGVMTAELREEVRHHKARLLELLRGGRAIPLGPLARPAEVPLSFAQSRLWFLDRRHETLRTTIQVNEAGEGVQRIAPRFRPELPLLDLMALEEPRREVEARRWILRETRRPFDLEHGPVVRFVLFGVGAERHLLLLTLHHVMADGWSMGILVREMAALYRAGLEGRVSPMRREPGFSSRDVLLAVTTLAFDISGLELYLPLLCGGRVEVAPRRAVNDAGDLARLLARSRATVMQATPATWRLLLESGWQGEATLSVLCGGEALPRDLAARLRAVCGKLWNLYGPTETTVWSAAGRVGGGEIAIGTPIEQTAIYVLERDGALAVPGAKGEIVISGEGLARGYPGRPGPTAERFRPDRLSGLPGVRLYHTGDLGRHHRGGTLEYLGRLDHQVKIRGFRIEPGEIEATLVSHPAVRHAVVSVWDLDVDPRLVAHVVGTAASRELRDFLGRHLPDYMVPASFVELEALPINPNGKLDRAALARHSPATAGWSRPDQLHVAPSTPIELELAAIWADVLGFDTAAARQVGIHDHFFEIGGHSLLAARVVARSRRNLGVELGLRTLFEKPTLVELATLVEMMSHDPDREPPPPIEPLDLPDLAIQYADFAAWQRRRLQGDVLERELSYWRRHLAGLPPLLDLPTDRPRRAVATTRSALVVRRWPPSRSNKVRQLGHRAGTSVFMTLMAGFTTLLHRLGPAGPQCRLTGRGPHPRGARAPGRLLRQHVGAPQLLPRRTVVRRAPDQDPRDLSRGLCTPGSTVASGWSRSWLRSAA